MNPRWRLFRLAALAAGAIPVILFPLAVWAHPGIGIVVDGKGNVYYTDLTQVWKIAPDGRRTVAVRSVHTHELWLDANGDLYGEHLWYEGDATGKFDYRVWRLTAGGKLEDVVPATQGMRTTYSFVRDAAGSMYSARAAQVAGALKNAEPGENPRTIVVRRARDGALTDVAGGGPPGQDGVGARAGFRNIRWIAAARDGTLFVVDGGDVRRIARDGPTGGGVEASARAGGDYRVTTLARDQGETVAALVWARPLHALMGLTPAPDGGVYVANYGARKLKKIAADGRVSVVSVSSYPWSPTGVAIGLSGELYVLEYAITNARVRRIAGLR